MTHVTKFHERVAGLVIGQDATLPVPEGQFIELETEHCEHCHAEIELGYAYYYNDLPYCGGCSQQPDPYDVAVDRKAEEK